MSRPPDSANPGGAAAVRIPKNATEEVRADLSQFSGARFLDVRTYFEKPDGEWLPTRKGVNVRADDISALVAGLYGLAQEAVRRGWVDAADLEAAMDEQMHRDIGSQDSAPRQTPRTRASAARQARAAE